MQETIWNDFFCNWRARITTEQTCSWNIFFDDYDKTACRRNGTTQTSAPISFKYFSNFLVNFKDCLNKDRSSGFCVDIFRVFRVGTNEIRMSSILAWLLSCDGDHGQGNLFLKALLKHIWDTGVPSDAVRSFPHWELNDYTYYQTRTETYPIGDGTNRVDIEIECPDFLLIIEVKIYAREGADQIGRYINIAKQKSSGRPWGVIFLTTSGNKPYEQNNHNLVSSLKWIEIAKIFSQEIKGLRCNRLGIEEESFVSLFVSQFCSHIKNL